MDRRSELEGWIAQTQRNQRTLWILVAAGVAVAIGLGVWRLNIGLIAFAIVAITAICGFWITASHLADWRERLDQVDQPPRTVGRRS